MVRTFFTLLFLINLPCFAQQTIQEIPMELQKETNVFQIVDNATKEVSLFLSDKESVTVLRLDSLMQQRKKLTVPKPDKKYTTIVGYNSDGEHNRVFWASKNNESLFAQVYDFESGKTSQQTYQLDLKDEVVLEQFSENSKFYILTIAKNSSLLTVHVFDEKGTLESKKIDLDGFHFFKVNSKRTDLYHVLEEPLTGIEGYFSLKRITSESPSSLSESAKYRKCYFNGKQLIITFDMNFAYTQVLTLDLEKFTATEKFINKPYMAYVDRSDIHSNSFLLEDLLYQVKISADKLMLTVNDLDGNVLQQYSNEGDNPIAFKNSDIIQEKDDTENTRILEKTSQFMRKINSSNLGISGYKRGDHFQITLGSISNPNYNGGPTVYGGLFGAGGVLLYYALANPTFTNFNSYAGRKVVYISSLFDKQGNHIPGVAQPLAFDKVRKFLDENKKMTAHTLFRLGADYYLGFYNPYDKKYKLKKFTD